MYLIIIGKDVPLIQCLHIHRFLSVALILLFDGSDHLATLIKYVPLSEYHLHYILYIGSSSQRLTFISFRKYGHFFWIYSGSVRTRPYMQSVIVLKSPRITSRSVKIYFIYFFTSYFNVIKMSSVSLASNSLLFDASRENLEFQVVKFL